MYSQNILARARRLTDTEPFNSKHELASLRESGSLGGGAPANTSNMASAPTAELLSVMSCHGGLETTKTATVGNVRLSYSVHTQAGADPGGNTKDNQDAWCVQERLGGQDMVLFGVFDGHGQEGKVVAYTICAQLPSIMMRLLSSKVSTTLEEALSVAFPEANRTLRHQPGLDADLSGSTGIVSVLTGNKLVVGNLGDSRCVLGKVDLLGNVSAVALSNDHTPMDHQEASRIIATGGRIASFMCGAEPLGPPRVWLREMNVPGLCMTRSFGDYVAASVGVLDQPQIITSTLKPHEDKYLVLMSDGIFEFLDSQQVMQEVHMAAKTGLSPNDAAKRLVKLARKCWKEQEDEIIDDCTCMVVYLSPAASTAATGNLSNSGGKVQAAAAAAALATKLDTGLRIGGQHGPAAVAAAESDKSNSNIGSSPVNINKITGSIRNSSSSSNKAAGGGATGANLHPGTLTYKHSK